ncbi:hypothetical protein HCN44_009069 [Aphidius gifuensis]|uniref:Uncharacterized protein n=1 Tax=Aphidius gifuensis TaxID=684658 RepID=A0A834Y3X9_APHGI|nr:hypothetical protein HCN44_009069 [Aphidius gifuensis]
MYVMESGGHRVAPASNRIKKVDYKSTNETSNGGNGGGGGGGGTHIAATVKNTVRRLLRRTKSHRDTPSVYPSSITSTSTITNCKTITSPAPVATSTATTLVTQLSNIEKSKTIGATTITTRTPINPSDGTVRRSQPPPPAPSSQYQTIRANTCKTRRNDYRQRPRIQSLT